MMKTFDLKFSIARHKSSNKTSEEDISPHFSIADICTPPHGEVQSWPIHFGHIQPQHLYTPRLDAPKIDAPKLDCTTIGIMIYNSNLELKILYH